MQGTSEEATAAAKAERLMAQLSSREDVALTLSIGIAAYPELGASYAELYQAADQAMYAAKRQGKSSYQLLQKLNRTDKTPLGWTNQSSGREGSFWCGINGLFCPSR